MVNPILTTSVSVGFETLRTNPLRTILSTLGIVIGVAALVSVLSVGDGMKRLARDQIGRTTDLQRIALTPRMFGRAR
jgi:putative ABC transport system permease protein